MLNFRTFIEGAKDEEYRQEAQLPICHFWLNLTKYHQMKIA